MSNKLVNDSRIINPSAKSVLTFEVFDDGKTQLQCALPPREAAKLLMGVAIDLMFGYSEALVDKVKNEGEREAFERQLKKV